jgi:hypothetical protein
MFQLLGRVFVLNNDADLAALIFPFTTTQSISSSTAFSPLYQQHLLLNAHAKCDALVTLSAEIHYEGINIVENCQLTTTV